MESTLKDSFLSTFNKTEYSSEFLENLNLSLKKRAKISFSPLFFFFFFLGGEVKSKVILALDFEVLYR